MDDFDFGDLATIVGCKREKCAIIMSGPPIEIYGQLVGPSIIFKSLHQTIGRFYYECKTITGGYMQIGWVDDSFQPDAERGRGCGDDSHSWAFDGMRCLKWHNNKKESYGCKWKAGDVIGIAIDIGIGEIRFSLNGAWEAPMGIAFEGISHSCGVHPCLTLLYGQRAQIFLGTESNPFFYNPPTGFQPLTLTSIRGEPVKEHDRYSGFTNIIELSLSTISTSSDFVGSILVGTMGHGLQYETQKNALIQAGYNEALIQLKLERVKEYMKRTELTNDEVLAIITYTLEKPSVYNFFNDASRKGLVEQNFPIIFYLLSEACKKILISNYESGTNRIVYRGMSNQCIATVGQSIRFGSFTSTTGNINIANKFKKSEGTMFIITTKMGVSIRELSRYPLEDEYLIPPFETFSVDKIDSSSVYLSSVVSDE